MESIYIQGQRLEYQWLGPAPQHAPTIVFLHEGLGCVAMWRDFPQRVAEATGYGGLVYSRAGYGNSDPIVLPRPVSFMHEEALNVLPEILEKFSVKNPILFGHSDGGSIALIHAGSDRSHGIRGLILEAPHVFVEDISVRSIQAAKTNYENGSLKAGLERYHGANVDCAFRGWNDVWLNLQFRSWNIESCLSNIKAPLLLIQGEDDEYGTLKQVSAIESQYGGRVQTVIIEHCGHSPHRDQPQKVIDSVSAFVASLN